MIGKTLGHYRIGEQLGRGGMGEVYLADDLNLNRKAALKFLPDAFTGDPERMARIRVKAGGCNHTGTYAPAIVFA
jgi:eukaryotic-like serine/threonine-protein kinase